MAHTPGVWHVRRPQHIEPWSIYDADEHPIAMFSTVRYPAEQNVRLMAAAPDLLEIVKMLHGVLEHEPATYANGLYSTSASRELVLEVLAKAEHPGT